MDPRKLYRDKFGNWRTRSLFLETFDPSLREKGYAPVFTLGEEDTVDPVTGAKVMSLKRIYLGYLDTTEHKVATACLGGLEHWEALCSSSMLLPTIEQWRKELRSLLAFKASQRILEQMESPNSGRVLDAAKWVWNENSGSGAKRSVGRPAKPPAQSSKADLDYAAELRRVQGK